MYKVNYFLMNLCISAMEPEINEQFLLRNEIEIRIERQHLTECHTGIKYLLAFFILLIIISVSLFGVCGEFPDSYICNNSGNGTQN